ncbi:conserved Plasmodium protein, unknown function [Plasmodium ovale curtisi]|uniref:Uncharacterized protein n=1 Tax=Plasmodium ovale curtisi TaxID=864141 RepID=A0A1A8VTB6_PLAOA|nr:conserved Plasmodium protein, unknown function [Plasmodium ovale curtisi]SBS91271.1 conserved Plasmodium protein, unknown function [Plasmodium ovale curtisi]
MKSCYSHKGVSPGKHSARSATCDKIGKEDIQSVNNGMYEDCRSAQGQLEDDHFWNKYTIALSEHTDNRFKDTYEQLYSQNGAYHEMEKKKDWNAFPKDPNIHTHNTCLCIHVEDAAIQLQREPLLK